MKNNPKKIVILRTDRIGEVLLSTVAIDAVKKGYPGVEVYFVTSEYSEPLISGRDDVEKVFLADTASRKGWFFRAIKLAFTLMPYRFDAAVILNPCKFLHLACFLAGIKIRAGYSRKWDFLLNRKMKDERDKGEKHEIEYTVDLLQLIEVDQAAPSPSIPVSNDSAKSVERMMEDMHRPAGKPLVVVHPGSSNPAKIWPPENFGGLIKKIKDDLDCEVVLLGSLEEKTLSAKVLNTAGVDVLDLTAKLNLKELAALLGKASLYIGNDNGPMHMAAALKVPVVAIFGRNIPGVSPRRWRPWGEGHTVFHKDPGCDPCYDTECPYEFKCLTKITVEEVFEAVKGVMTQSEK